jgi:hypothetical protein
LQSTPLNLIERGLVVTPIGQAMTRLLDEAVATVASLPDEQQDEFARILLQLAGHEQPVYVLTPQEEADLDASIAAEERGDFATDEEMLAIRAKYAR